MQNDRNTLSESNNIGFMRLEEVLKIFAISRTTLYRWIEQGRLPKPIQIGQRMTRWDRREIAERARHLAEHGYDANQNKA